MRIKYEQLFFVFASCMLFTACKNANSKQNNDANSLSTDTTNQQLQNNKALVLKLYQALNDTNWALAKTLVDENFEHHFVKDTGFGVTSWNGFEKGYRMSLKAFPDWKLTPINVVAEGDYVSVLLSGQGTHRDEFAGIPATNRKAGAPIMLLHQIKEGKIIEDWEVMNAGSFLEQLKRQ